VGSQDLDYDACQRLKITNCRRGFQAPEIKIPIPHTSSFSLVAEIIIVNAAVSNLDALSLHAGNQGSTNSFLSKSSPMKYRSFRLKSGGLDDGAKHLLEKKA